MNFQKVLSILLRKNFVYFTINISYSAKIHSRNFLKCKQLFKQGNCLYYSDYPPKCWQCNYPYKSDFFCSKCKALQKLPKNFNYFDIIGVKQDFDVVVTDIKKKYRQLQTLLHPDKFVQKSEEEKEISKDISSLINKAYSTLVQPLDRGLYMLELHNVRISEETTNLDQEFLMEIMEKNEEIETAFENREKVLELSKKNQDTLASLTKEISKAFHNKDIDQATKLLIKMKYYVSLDKRLKNLKQNLGIVK